MEIITVFNTRRINLILSFCGLNVVVEKTKKEDKEQRQSGKWEWNGKKRLNYLGNDLAVNACRTLEQEYLS